MAIDRIEVAAYSIPTTFQGRAQPESDGTATWDSTGVLTVTVHAEGEAGLGYAYTSAAAALRVVSDLLAPVVVSADPHAPTALFWSMAAALRNAGWAGLASSALSAVDVAVHDLRAKLMGAPLIDVLGRAAESVAGYGSGGFTSESRAELETQLGGWAEQGYRAVKMKVGRDPDADPARVSWARAAIGQDTSLFVDANGAYTRTQALALAEVFSSEAAVSWFEEPVSSDDLEGLRTIRAARPAGMRIAAGEYGWTPQYFHRMLAADAVDVLQADATRCGGVTGFLLAAAQARTAGVPLSAHTSPALHAMLGCVADGVMNVECFHDHLVIEDQLLDSLPTLRDGRLHPPRDRPGHGLALKPNAYDDRLIAKWASD